MREIDVCKRLTRIYWWYHESREDHSADKAAPGSSRDHLLNESRQVRCISTAIAHFRRSCRTFCVADSKNVHSPSAMGG